jgi:hypothetical protein
MRSIISLKRSKPGPVSSLQGKNVGESILAPMTLTGIVVPWTTTLTGRRDSEFKLASLSGAEYFIVADSEWKEVLEMYRWEEVKVIGLLNLSDMTLILQKVFPKGPRGETESAMNLPAPQITSKTSHSAIDPALQLRPAHVSIVQNWQSHRGSRTYHPCDRFHIFLERR